MQELVKEFLAWQKGKQARQASKEGIQALQVQWEPKEGILSWAKLMPSHMSPTTWLQSARHYPLPLPLGCVPKAKPTYAQITKKPPRDPEKRACDPGIQSRDRPHDQTGSKPSHDPACNPGKEPPDQPRDWSAIWLCVLQRFGRATHPLIGTWKTVGRINDFTEEITKTCFSLTN